MRASATKIGGRPCNAQSGPGTEEGYIAQAASFAAYSQRDPFPWLNVATPAASPHPSFTGLSFMDLGTFNFFAKPGGRVDFHIDSF